MSRDLYVDGVVTDSAITTYDGERLGYDTLIPGTKTQGDIIYEIPENWSEILIRIKKILGGEATFRITPDVVN